MPWGRDGEGGGGSGEQQPNDTIFAANLPADFDEERLKETFGAYGQVTWSKIMKGGKGGATCLVQYATVDDATFIKENPEVLSFEEQPIVSYQRKKAPQAAAGPRPPPGPPPGMGPIVIKGNGGGGPIVIKGNGGGERFSPYGGKGGGAAAQGAMGGTPGDVGNLKKGLGKVRVLPVSTWKNDEGAVFVSGLPGDTEDQDLYEIFAPFGAIPPRGVKAMKGGDGACTGIGFVDFISPEHAQMAVATLNGYTNHDGTQLRVTPKKAKRG